MTCNLCSQLVILNIHHVCLCSCFYKTLFVCLLLLGTASYNTYESLRDWNSRQYVVRTIIGTKTKILLIKTTVRSREATQTLHGGPRLSNTLSFPPSLSQALQRSPAKRTLHTSSSTHTLHPIYSADTGETTSKPFYSENKGTQPALIIPKAKTHWGLVRLNLIKNNYTPRGIGTYIHATSYHVAKQSAATQSRKIETCLSLNLSQQSAACCCMTLN